MLHIINFSSSIETLTAFISLFLGLYLLSLKKQTDRHLIGMFLLTFSAGITLKLLVSNQVLSPLFIFFDVWLYLPVFVYFLLSLGISLFGNKTHWGKLLLPVPWLLNNFHSIYCLMQPVGWQSGYLKSDYFRNYCFAFGIFSAILMIALMIWALKNTTLLQKKLARQDTAWVKRLIAMLLVIGAARLAETLVDAWVTNSLFVTIVSSCTIFFVFITICGIGFDLFRASGFFQKAPGVTGFDVAPKGEGIQMTEEQEAIYNQLEQLLNKVYANPELSLGYLALKLGVKNQVLSKVIYGKTGLHYYDYINRLRITKFKEMLESKVSKQLSIEGMAKELGFKSKSTFYKYFKKTEGTTPTKYQQRVNAA